MKFLTLFLALSFLTLGNGNLFAKPPVDTKKKPALKVSSDPELRKQILQVMKSTEVKINRCKNRYLKVNEHQSGQIDVSLQITPKGSVHALKVKSDLRRNAYVHSCVLSVVRSWRFPKHRSDNISTRFSVTVQKGKVFKFSPPQGKNANNTKSGK